MKDAKVCLNDPVRVVPEWKGNASLRNCARHKKKCYCRYNYTISIKEMKGFNNKIIKTNNTKQLKAFPHSYLST